MKKTILFSVLFMCLTFLLFPRATQAAAQNLEYTYTKGAVTKTVIGHLVTTTSGKRLQYADGTYVKSAWISRGKKTWYFKKSGYAATGWTKISGYWYYFKKSGVQKKNLSTSQYVLVKSSSYTAKVYMIQLVANGQYKQLKYAKGFVGRQGVNTVKRESDSRTPKGTFTFGRAFGVSSNPGASLPYTKVNSSHYWVDDPASAYYNQFVSTNTTAKDWNSAEHLIDYPTAYAYAIAINYNTSCKPGYGSAIFLHCATGGGTAGCVSVPQSTMIYILKNIHDDARIAIW